MKSAQVMKVALLLTKGRVGLWMCRAAGAGLVVWVRNELRMGLGHTGRVTARKLLSNILSHPEPQ